MDAYSAADASAVAACVARAAAAAAASAGFVSMAAAKGAPACAVARTMTTNPFFEKLCNMLVDVKYQDVIAWDASGDSFTITDSKRMSREVLPRYYRHNNFSSFQRQLNYYGFRQHKRTKALHQFSNDLFTLSAPDKMTAIYRKTYNSGRRVPCAVLKLPPKRAPVVVKATRRERAARSVSARASKRHKKQHLESKENEQLVPLFDDVFEEFDLEPDEFKDFGISFDSATAGPTSPRKHLMSAVDSFGGGCASPRIFTGEDSDCLDFTEYDANLLREALGV